MTRCNAFLHLTSTSGRAVSVRCGEPAGHTRAHTGRRWVRWNDPEPGDAADLHVDSSHQGIARALLDLAQAKSDLAQALAERDRARDLAARLLDQVCADETWIVNDGLGPVRMRTHHRDACQGRGCVVHHHSGHALADWPIQYRPGTGVAERICKHGAGHPDPDDLAYRHTLDPDEDGIYGCDGCCTT